MGRRKLNITKSQMRSLIKEFKTDSAIARHYKVSKQAIGLIRRAYGIKNPYVAQQQKLWKKLDRYSFSPLSNAEIAKRTGLSVSMVCRHRRRIEGPRSNSSPTKKQEQKIVQMYKLGKPYYEIQKESGFSKTTILKVVNRNGLKKRITPFRVSKQRLEKLYNKWESDYEVARIVGKPQFLVFYWRRKYDIPTIPKDKRTLKTRTIVEVSCMCGKYRTVRDRISSCLVHSLVCDRCKRKLSHQRHWKVIGKAKTKTRTAALKKYL